MLYLVSTPIGNLGDFSFRGVECLKCADLILCEDTRRSVKLLSHYCIKNRLESFNEHNEKRKLPFVIGMLKGGKNICLISDCGTPCISDPGFILVREAVKNNIQISVIPGASAAVSALIASGLPMEKFTFLGFLPKKMSHVEKLLISLKDRSETIIVYESPYRIMKTLDAFSRILPDSNIALAREMTKKFEEFIYGKPNEIVQKIGNRVLKGEFAIVFSCRNP